VHGRLAGKLAARLLDHVFASGIFTP
jgi:hypothetical protein